MLDFGKSILNAQPFSILLGTEIRILKDGEAELVLDIKEEFQQNHGFVHGGVISYLADNCLTFAGGSVLGDCVTSEYKINYVRPAIGDKLIAKSTVLSFGKNQAVCDCKMYVVQSTEEKLVAVAQGTIVKLNKT